LYRKLLWLLLPPVKALQTEVSTKSNCAGRMEMDLLKGISIPPPMMKSHALLLGFCVGHAGGLTSLLQILVGV